MNTRTRFITRTAILLALTVAVQMAGRALPTPASSFVVGPLVNACILVATAFTGIWGGILISVLSPFTSLINNHAPIASVLLFFAPFVAVGNAILASAFYFLRKKNMVAGMVIGAVIKFGFLFAAIKVFLSFVKVQPKMAETLTTLFTYPQLITALIGSVVAFAVIKALKKNTEME